MDEVVSFELVVAGHRVGETQNKVDVRENTVVL